MDGKEIRPIEIKKIDLDLIKKAFELLGYDVEDRTNGKYDNDYIYVAVNFDNEYFYVLNRGDAKSFVELGNEHYKYSKFIWDIEEYINKQMEKAKPEIRLLYQSLKEHKEFKTTILEKIKKLLKRQEGGKCMQV